MRLVPAIVAVVLTTGACGGRDPSGPTGATAVPTSFPSAFTASPVDLAHIQFIVPLGNLGPIAHTLPTDHIYFYVRTQSGVGAPEPVFAPGPGVITNIFRAGSEVKVWVRVNSALTYYLDHLTPLPSLTIGATLEAGQALGTATGIAFDFGAVNQNVRVPFANPQRYSDDTNHTDAPLRFFDEPIRSALYGKVQRVGGGLDGQISYDREGTLAGNWFAEGLSPAASVDSSIPDVARQQLALARDARFPDRQRVSIGGLGMTGLWGVPPDAPDFASITAASGLVTYRLLATGEPGGPPGTTQVGLLLVELTEGGRLRVEAVPDSLGTTARYSSHAQVYVR